MRKRLSPETRNKIATVADAIVRVKGDDSVPSRDQVLSSLRQLPVWANEMNRSAEGSTLETQKSEATLETMPFTQMAVDALFERLVPEIIGVSEKRLQNARRDCHIVMERHGLARQRLRVKLSPAVEAFAQRLAKFERVGLGQFLTFLSVRGLDPLTVNDEIAEQFRVWLTSSGQRKADAIWRRCLSLWNRADANPGVKLTIPKRRETWGVPWHAFPSSLRQEVDEFFAKRVEGE